MWTPYPAKFSVLVALNVTAGSSHFDAYLTFKYPCLNASPKQPVGETEAANAATHNDDLHDKCAVKIGKIMDMYFSKMSLFREGFSL